MVDGPIREILTIAEGYAGERTTSSARRAHAWRVCYKEVFTIGRASVGGRWHFGGVIITFGEKDEEGILHLHNDSLVMTMQVANFMA